MVYIPAPSVAQVEIRGTLDTQPVENVLYFLYKAPPVTPANVATLAMQVGQWWITNALPWLPVTYLFREIYATDLSTATSSASTWPAENNPGTRNPAGGVLPNSNTLCISFRTNQRGRSARGRNYWPGLSRSDVTNNSATLTLQQGIVGVYEALLTLVGDDTINWYWVVLSRFTNGAPRPQGLTNTITSVLIVDSTIDSQRRRLPGRGA
jgi:hypothetical protein